MKKNKQLDEDSKRVSKEILHLYSGFEEEEPDKQFRKQRHNELVLSALNESEAANSDADKANIYVQKLQRMALAKKIQQIFFAIFGVGIIIWVISLAPVENGILIFSAELIGLLLGGIGILLTSFFSFFSWDDDIMQLLLVSRSDENQIFAEFSLIQAQLSFIKNEIIDIKREKS